MSPHQCKAFKAGVGRAPIRSLIAGCCALPTPLQHFVLSAQLPAASTCCCLGFCVHVVDLRSGPQCVWMTTPASSPLRWKSPERVPCAGSQDSPQDHHGVHHGVHYSVHYRHPSWLPLLTSLLSCWSFLKSPFKGTTCTQILS